MIPSSIPCARTTPESSRSGSRSGITTTRGLLLNRLYPERGKLVEVGSSLGYLLDVFRKDGWDVLGVEPFYQCCRYSREELGLEIKNAILETAELPDESFDVVLLNHVIEHIDDPFADASPR